MPGIGPAKWVTVCVAIVSPAWALAHNRAATLSARASEPVADRHGLSGIHADTDGQR